MITEWKLIGNQADLRIAEFKMDGTAEGHLSYEDAKVAALERLRSHVAPFLSRIQELENNRFQVDGALPPLKAWQSCYGKMLIVTSRTKKRAMELVRESRHGFENEFGECDGDWWYHLAHEEAVWKENQNSDRRGNGTFHRWIKPEEASLLLEQHIAQYRNCPIDHLLLQLDDERIDRGATSFGTPYKITTRVWLRHNDTSKLVIENRIDDGFGVVWHPPAIVERLLPIDEMAVAIDWRKEGF